MEGKAGLWGVCGGGELSYDDWTAYSFAHDAMGTFNKSESCDTGALGSAIVSQ